MEKNNGGCHYLRHKECLAIVCINKNLEACICPDIKHYESISFASIIALKASGRDCTNNNELLHIIGVFQRYAMQLFVFTSKILQAIRWRSKYNDCTQRI